MARCPQCKEPVSQFAAGCAICGADLDAARRTRASRRRPTLPHVAAVPQSLLVGVVMALLTLLAPIVGVLITLLVIRRENATRQRPLRAALWVVAAAGIVLIGNPATRFGGVLVYVNGA